MPHDPALEAHEHAEHAHHAAHAEDPFIARVAITVAALAVIAAAATSLETIEGGLAITASSEAVLAQDKATDAWSEYQADSIKKHLYGIAAREGGPHAAEFAEESKSQSEKQDPIKERAGENETESTKLVAASEAHERRHHWLTGAATMVEIGIALSTVAIITRKRSFWAAALGLGVAGLAVGAVAFL
jgi:Domain of unknown function (DUF4337)